MKKNLKIILISILSITVILISAILIYFYADNYKEFYDSATAEFDVPGLKEGFIPQGMTEITGDHLLLSGYMKKGPSRIYTVNKKTNETKYVTIEFNGEDFNGHCGGITNNGKFVWISSESKLLRLDLKEILSAENTCKVKTIDYFNPNNNASFCYFEKNCLFVGEFYREKNYKTNESHYFDVAGRTNKAIVSAYIYNESKPCALEEIPKAILSIPDLVQGIAFDEGGRIILSTSYGLANSKIFVHKKIDEGNKNSIMNCNGNNVPVYFLDDNSLLLTIEAPCMSEEIFYSDNKLYILFESASVKYKAVVRESLSKCYSIKIS